jgi:hypothetical protein
MKRFKILCPGMIYAADEYATSKRKAINQYKRRWKLNRMPNKSIIWQI